MQSENSRPLWESSYNMSGSLNGLSRSIQTSKDDPSLNEYNLISLYVSNSTENKEDDLKAWFFFDTNFDENDSRNDPLNLLDDLSPANFRLTDDEVFDNMFARKPVDDQMIYRLNDETDSVRTYLR